MSIADISKGLLIPDSTLRDWAKKGVNEDKRKNSGRRTLIPEIEE